MSRARRIAAAAHRRKTLQASTFVFHVPEEIIVRSGFSIVRPHYRTKQYKQFKRLALAGIYETATDRKVNDNDRLGSTSELLARHRQHIGRLSQWSRRRQVESFTFTIYMHVQTVI